VWFYGDGTQLDWENINFARRFSDTASLTRDTGAGISHFSVITMFGSCKSKFSSTKVLKMCDFTGMELNLTGKK
jgi:hypothetical protein